jgi:hypothetical protein
MTESHPKAKDVNNDIHQHQTAESCINSAKPRRSSDQLIGWK